MTEWAWFGIAAAVLVVLTALPLVLFRIFIGPIVGPMFRYELVRLSRRGAIPKLRALLVGLLLVALFITYLREFPVTERANFLFEGDKSQMSIDQTAKFGNNFFIAFMAAQLATVMLITPAVAASAISEEKERGTFDYLISSMLTSREILLGKLAARMVYVAGVVLAGVPVLSLTALFGGIDFRVMLAGYLITAITGISLGAFSIYLSVRRDNLRDVLIWVYGAVALLTVFGFCCFCIPGVPGVSPVTTLVFMFAETGINAGTVNPAEPVFWINLGVLAVFHLPLSVLFTCLAMAGVRNPPPVRRRTQPVQTRYVGKAKRWPTTPQHKRATPVEPRSDDEPPKPPVIVPVDTGWEDNREYIPLPRARRSFWVPRLGDSNPFLWKERYFTTRMNATEGGLVSGCGIGVLSAILFVLGMSVFTVILISTNKNEWFGDSLNPILRVFMCGSVILGSLGLASRAAASIARERQKQTLTALLTIPVSRASILWAKWLAPIVWARYALIAVGVCAVLTLLVGGVHPVGFIVGMAQVLAFLLFASTLGLWLSVRCTTGTRATVYALIWMLSLWFLPLVLAPILEPVFAVAVEMVSGEPVDNGEDIVHMFSLPVGVWNSLFGWDEFKTASLRPSFLVSQAAGLFAAFVYALLAGLFWLGAVWKFETEGRN